MFDIFDSLISYFLMMMLWFIGSGIAGVGLSLVGDVGSVVKKSSVTVDLLW